MTLQRLTIQCEYQTTEVDGKKIATALLKRLDTFGVDILVSHHEFMNFAWEVFATIHSKDDVQLGTFTDERKMREFLASLKNSNIEMVTIVGPDMWDDRGDNARKDWDIQGAYFPCDNEEVQ